MPLCPYDTMRRATTLGTVISRSCRIALRYVALVAFALFSLHPDQPDHHHRAAAERSAAFDFAGPDPQGRNA